MSLWSDRKSQENVSKWETKEEDRRKKRKEKEREGDRGRKGKIKVNPGVRQSPRGGKDNDRAVIIATPLLALHWLGMSFLFLYQNTGINYDITIVQWRWWLAVGKRDWSTHTVELNPTGYIDSVKDRILYSLIDRYSPYLHYYVRST